MLLTDENLTPRVNFIRCFRDYTPAVDAFNRAVLGANTTKPQPMNH
jgi:hypothetical protein